ncbi:MAG: hypothetical protein JWR47_3116 [Phenylobacterium sp.]|jgi:hypothetical protein|uniref:DUF6894 family protein n=1 Tax=Phenylobacterium sp. TaxID=1871053 RepID=UPI002631ACC3|nr:hypothetical protein [Phenylobacterium sp.]MDB5426484.1 hypothetical protein [Phenylobacterium sp.]MDB5436859.1 hypothetical protein [Phenylobacterium sp.]MDB5463845.1 hypothetical protein [Phenylobacterium sp.]MDB5498340.1 hypothetical protein [Phenylobacterium sp.]
MPRYFFHTEDGRRFPDEEGTELADAAAARDEAAAIFGELLKERPQDLWRGGGLRLTVTDETGLILYVLDMNAVASPSASAAGRA